MILPFPGLFRFTCYYYRKAYYRAFAGSPPGCAVSPGQRPEYHGETRLLIFQNLHRYALYIALVYVVILTYDAVLSFFKNGEFGIGVGSLVITLNTVLIASYTLLYVGVKTLETYLQFGITRLIGPHDIVFWSIALPLVSLVPLLVIEPLRVAVIAGAYDATLGRLRAQRASSSDARDEPSADEPPAEEPPAQDSAGNRMNRSSPTGSTSTQNGPSTSSGTTNPTTSL